MAKRDHKEVWADAYYAAIDDGCSVKEAEKIADKACLNFVEELYEAADYYTNDY